MCRKEQKTALKGIQRQRIYSKQLLWFTKKVPDIRWAISKPVYFTMSQMSAYFFGVCGGKGALQSTDPA
jgi:hypothetical protein